ncbi:hypothetical protein D6789_03185 [Candidatus Woesearchaeota archaeon]|nr:MAG: hypothetical protein D6789_03185 [Candidatus Woesearchaeota archaeon]
MDIKTFEQRLVQLLKRNSQDEDVGGEREEEAQRTVVPRAQLIEYIMRYSAQGIERERIRNALLQLNIAEDEVDAAFALAEGRPLPDPEKERWEERKPLLTTIVTFIVLSGIAITLLIMFFPKPRFVCAGPACLARIDDACSPRPIAISHSEWLRGAELRFQLDGAIIGRAVGECKLHLALTQFDVPPALREYADSLIGSEMDCRVTDADTSALKDLVAQCQGPLRDAIAQFTGGAED